MSSSEHMQSTRVSGAAAGRGDSAVCSTAAVDCSSVWPRQEAGGRRPLVWVCRVSPS